MKIPPALTPTQVLLLRAAARRADGRVVPPNNLRGGARVKVLTALLRRGWIEPADGGHTLIDAGYAAIGLQRTAQPDEVQPMDNTDDLQRLEGIPVRPGTKLAALVLALRRPQGATTLQLVLATGWQPHTVRGAISGMLRKRLGLNVVLAQSNNGERVYRVAWLAAQEVQFLETLAPSVTADEVQTCKPGTHPGSHLLTSP